MARKAKNTKMAKKNDNEEIKEQIKNIDEKIAKYFGIKN